MSADDDALKLVNDFEKDGSTGGVWTNIRKDELVSGLRERIRNKDGLNQQKTGMCAEASLVHIELKDDPTSFVVLATGLYKSGQASWRGKVIKPSAELQANRPPDGLIVNGTAQVFNRADWIVMSSIRYTISPTIPDGTQPGELEAFIRALGYTNIKPDYGSSSMPETNARAATDLLAKKYRVLLHINANMLSSETQTTTGRQGTGFRGRWAAVMNHAVQLVAGFYFSKWSGALIDTDVISGVVYTWGDGHRNVPEHWDNPLSVSDFLDNYYGYLAFKDGDP